jgi:hypothetical protein
MKSFSVFASRHRKFTVSIIGSLLIASQSTLFSQAPLPSTSPATVGESTTDTYTRFLQMPAPSRPPATVGENTQSTYTRFLQMPASDSGNPATAPLPKTESERRANLEAFKQFSDKLRNEMRARAPLRSARRVEAAKAIEAAKGRASQMARLLKNQEERTPQPDVNAFLANTPLLEEVATGDDRDFAQVIFWNEVALNVTANDHTPLPPGSTLATNPFEQVGPVKTARALAIVHISMFEAINAALRKYKSYTTKDGKTVQEKIFMRTGFPPTKPASEVSVRTAIAYAAYRSLLGVYPKKSGYLTPILVENLAAVENPGDTNKIIAGQAFGETAAQVILEDRTLDGSEYSIEEPPVQFFSSADPMKWKKDPLNADPNVALGALWQYVRPFVGSTEELFKLRPEPPPPIDPNSDVFKEVLNKGADPHAGERNPPGNSDRRGLPTTRTDEETFIGKFWAYDATALLCAPPRLYNMIATSLALKEERDKFPGALELARYLALVNVALGDAGIGAWEAKFYYRCPRPVTAIREMSAPDSPQRFWAPLGAPVSNAQPGRVNFTPPFPSYPSGHAVFGGALFEILRKYFGTDDIAFDFVSDEFNGKNRDAGESDPRPLKPRHFNRLSDAESENGQSRIYLGIHWKFDALKGIEQGNKIADRVFDNIFQKADE